LCANRLGLPRAGLSEFGFDPSQTVGQALQGLRHRPALCGLRERHTCVNAGHTAVALALGLKVRDWKAHFEAAIPAINADAVNAPAVNATAPDALALYAGRYTHPADGDFQLELSGTELKGNFLPGYCTAFSATQMGEHRFAIDFESAEWQGLVATVATATTASM
jgi:hypothetical protein